MDHNITKRAEPLQQPQHPQPPSLREQVQTAHLPVAHLSIAHYRSTAQPTYVIRINEYQRALLEQVMQMAISNPTMHIALRKQPGEWNETAIEEVLCLYKMTNDLKDANQLQEDGTHILNGLCL